MKTVLSTVYVNVPRGVTVTAKSREVTVTGPKGTLVRTFRHARVDLEVVSKKRVKCQMWGGNRKMLSQLRTTCSQIENMITGVTKGYLYKMRLAYNHFPINVEITKVGDATNVKVRNFVGQKIVGDCTLPPGVTVVASEDVKDQLEISGIDLEDVSGAAASIHQSCTVRNKDIRKFLDGIFVSEKGPVGSLKPV